ncbi:uncharacterized protein [Hetaerina americana]|uniref:uncharacterized protein n=1 Tax=Hetaerina americana TaxID=62018 RepID=UPI003A7F58C9
MVEYCLRNSYFLWNEGFYEQREGAAMGSPLSPVIANLSMEKSEESATETYSKKAKLWLRYVDDTFVIWQHGIQERSDFVSDLNNQHRAIQFTMELEKNKQIPFLDVLVKRKEDGSLGHAVYRKATHTDRYLNSLSHHHPAQKASLVELLVHRAYELSDAESLSAEKKHTMTALQKNVYKSSVVLKRTAKEEKRRLNHSEIRSEAETTKAYAKIPDIAGTSEKISRILRKHNIAMRYNCLTMVSHLLPRPKDKIPEELREVPCIRCRAHAEVHT